MRALRVLVAVGLLPVLASCSVLGLSHTGGGSRAPARGPSETLSLYVDQSAGLEDRARIGFGNVVNDSRCPRGTKCIWAGTATVRLWLVPPGGDSVAVLAVLPGGVGREETGAVLPADTLGYRLTLLELEPYPEAGRSFAGVRPRALVRVELPAAPRASR